jgi:FKBP-type peptidyl-prolyl cis-trans isomerase SlyD
MNGESEETATNAADEDVEEESASEMNAEQTEQTEGSAEQAEGLQDGDFIKIAYTARTVDEGMLVDTTDEEVAEEEGVADEGTFEPRTIVLGAGHIVESVEEGIIGTDIGSTGSVVVPPTETFGEHDQEEIQTVSADKIPEDDRYPGAQVQIENQQGYLETIIGGRARVDFNHPLAGEDIEYEYEVLDVVEDDLERVNGLMNMFFDFDLDMHIQTDEVEEEQMVEPDEEEAEADEAEDEESEPEFETVTVEKETLYIESTPQLSMNQQWLFQKQQIAQQLMDQVDLDRVIIQEVIDGSGGMGMGMPGMMGGGGAGGADIDEALEEADVDADEILDEIDADIEEESEE